MICKIGNDVVSDTDFKTFWESHEDTRPTYSERVERLIRERYTVSDELAILRQKDEKPEDYAEYYAFAEDCKVRARGQ